MTYKHLLLLISFLLFTLYSKAQIRKVWVETYYISDSNDATDTTGGRSIVVGSKTYRVYIDMEPGSRIKKIYGDANHALIIKSTADFYNNVDRPSANFGYQINKSWLPDNPTMALDSWLTIGLATKTQFGVLKNEDHDGSVLANNGGTAIVPGGLLANTNPAAGIPLSSADGMIPNFSVPGQWLDIGFKDNSGIDTTIFGSINSGSQFISNNVLLQQNAGVAGNSPDSNRVLVAQLTSAGELSFELNLEIDEIVNGITTTVKYVANDAVLLSGEKVSPELKYPPVCGCRDPHYLEYSDKYACDSPDSCKNLIVYGCLDKNACNYNSDANFDIPSLCCYPGYCNDRNIEVVCPSVNDQNRMALFNLYPNPGKNNLFINISSDISEDTKVIIFNSNGRQMLLKNLGNISGDQEQHLDISDLPPGIYLIHMYRGNTYSSKTFMKE